VKIDVEGIKPHNDKITHLNIIITISNLKLENIGGRLWWDSVSNKL